MKNIVLGIFVILMSSCASNKIPMLQSMEEMDYKYPVKKIALSDDTTIAYADQGSGEQTLILIHGLGSYLRAWENNIEALSENYRVIAVDLPGYGKSSKGNYEFSMTYYAGVLKEISEVLELKNVVLVGHSMGGQIALTAALQYPQWVEKMVLVAPAGFEKFNKGEREWFRNVMALDAVKYTTVEQIRTNLSYNFYNMPEEAEFMFTDRVAMRGTPGFDGYCYAVSESVKGMVDQPIYEFLPEIKQPTLVIFGENDNLIPNRFLNGGKTEKYVRDGVGQMPNAELIMLSKTGHFAQFETSEKVNSEIKNFLE